MRPIRSLSRKNSVNKAESESQKGFTSSFIKLQTKNVTKMGFSSQKLPQSTNLSIWNDSKLSSYEMIDHQTPKNQSSKQKKFHKIFLSSEELLHEKQTIIDHLKLELQESRYIINSLKNQNKELTSQLQQLRISLEKTSIQRTNQIFLQPLPNCIQCIQFNHLKEELNFWKEKSQNQQIFSQMYEGLISKLQHKIENLENLNPQFQEAKNKVPHFHQNSQNYFYHEQNHLLSQQKMNQNFMSKTQNQPTQTSISVISLKQNNFSLNNFDTTFRSSQSSTKNPNLSISTDTALKLTPKQKQNHPSTPKSNFPLSLQKKKTFCFENKENDENFLGLTSSIKVSEPQRKVVFSPFKMKQKLMGKDIKSEKFKNFSEIDSMPLGNARLDKKIYI